jgi:hypothetical protein
VPNERFLGALILNRYHPAKPSVSSRSPTSRWIAHPTATQYQQKKTRQYPQDSKSGLRYALS